jgi:hypothetical protein
MHLQASSNSSSRQPIHAADKDNNGILQNLKSNSATSSNSSLTNISTMKTTGEVLNSQQQRSPSTTAAPPTSPNSSGISQQVSALIGLNRAAVSMPWSSPETGISTSLTTDALYLAASQLKTLPPPPSLAMSTTNSDNNRSHQMTTRSRTAATPRLGHNSSLSSMSGSIMGNSVVQAIGEIALLSRSSSMSELQTLSRTQSQSQSKSPRLPSSPQLSTRAKKRAAEQIDIEAAHQRHQLVRLAMMNTSSTPQPDGDIDEAADREESEAAPERELAPESESDIEIAGEQMARHARTDHEDPADRDAEEDPSFMNYEDGGDETAIDDAEEAAEEGPTRDASQKRKLTKDQRQRLMKDAKDLAFKCLKLCALRCFVYRL